jgi:superoxide dismutase
MSAEAVCTSGGGVWEPEEGSEGICFGPDVIEAGAFVIRQVDLDDADGGLLVWDGPGAPGSKVPQEDKYVETGVIPPYADGVTATGHATPDDLWYYVRYQGFEGWARSAFLEPAATAPPLPACLTGSSGPIPGTAQGVTALDADFDGRGGQDTFSVYWNGSDWIAHLRTAYGFHAEMATGHTGDAPGGGGDVFAGLAYDFGSDGQFEAWVYDTAIMSGEVWSLFAWFNSSCRLHHVTHHDGGLPEYFTIDATVTHVNAMECFPSGVAHYNGAANGPNTYAGQAWEHAYLFDDGLGAAEWYMVDGMVWNEVDGDTIPAGFECP